MKEEFKNIKPILKKKEFEYYYIYKTTNLINGKIYVGQHRTNNINDNYIGCGVFRQSSVRYKGGFQGAVAKYGYENFKREIIEFCNIENIDKREEFWIEELKSFDRNIGYNLTKKAGGGYINEETYLRLSKLYKGRKLTEEQKRKISIANKGKSHSNTEIQKIRISLANSGKVRSDIVKERISKTLKSKYSSLELIHPMIGKNHTDESKEKNRQAHLGKKASNETKIKMSSIRKGKKIHNEESINKIRNANIGRKLTNDAKIKMRESWTNREELTCPHCGLKSKNASNMKRWHFEKCKNEL